MTKAIAFIDSAVPDYQRLIAGIQAGTEVHILDSNEDGIVQITQLLDTRKDIETVHIVSHGSPGCLYLGSSTLSLDTLDRYAWDLQGWFPFTPTPTPYKLLIYGCNIAAGDAGADFLKRLSQLTGANIAASAKPTGSSALGGDWNLEFTIGKIEPALAFSAEVMQAYDHVLLSDRL